MVARKQSKAPTQIWSFHSLPPVGNVLKVQDLIFLGNHHYNNLIRLERDRTDAFRDIRERFIPGLDDARRGFEQISKEYEEVDELVKKSRAKEYREAKTQNKTKKTREVPPELKARYDELKARKKALGERFKELTAKFKTLTEPATNEWKRRREERAGKAGPRIKERVNAEVLAEMLAEDWPEAWKEIARLEADCVQKQKDLRAKSELPHGCYSLVETAAAQAIKTSWKESGRPPGFRRFDGSGRVGVQVMNSTFGDVLDGKCPMLRLKQRPPRGNPRDGEHFIASIRLGSNEADIRLGDADEALARLPKGLLKKLSAEEIVELKKSWNEREAKAKSVWADFPVRLHRLPPRDVKVKWAWFRLKRIGGERFKYQFQLTLEGESLNKQRAFGNGPIEVMFCSRAHEDGTCVADWTAPETGEIGHVVLPKRLVERLDYPAVLRGHADAHVDEVMRVISLWTHMGGNKLIGRRPSKQHKRDAKRTGKSRQETVRIGLRLLCTKWANQTLGQERLTKLWHLWRAHRLMSKRDLFPVLGDIRPWFGKQKLGSRDGNECIAFWLFLWTLKDKHLRQMAGNMREGAEHARDAIFRQAAIDLSKVYGEFVHFDQKLAEEKKAPEVEEESNEFQRVRTLRQNVAPGRCRELFKDVFGKGRTIVKKREGLGGDEPPGGSRGPKNDGNLDASSDETVNEIAAE